ncbi:hypothetical protein H6F43_04220 [Leptolyngbya sp. FACHB-36]|uniref:hypothetical protein n=1 Tax=Leptolyngbya sp. FACHB-36 TaxID=2692808 RepID=UPI0016813E83|nr:hypothetical protein [Leptolyngbya sp. FACHB-36]MBD2019389.1 hypothetical protein [Leptolyngbya sp. FACHB-36]
MQLNEYPSAIAEVSIRINTLEDRITLLQQAMQRIEDEVRHATAFDRTLADSDQRNATLAAQLGSNEVFQDLSAQLRETYPQRAELMTEVARLRDEFSVAKIQAQRQIAEMERCRNA